MGKRQKWWMIGLLQFSLFVKFLYILGISLLVAGMNVVPKAISQLPEIGPYFNFSILIILALSFVTYQYIKRAKREYEEKQLGY
ncbi:MAG TPA: hypothetical protein VIG80_01360 [Bacillaceae bacterium]